MSGKDHRIQDLEDDLESRGGGSAWFGQDLLKVPRLVPCPPRHTQPIGKTSAKPYSKLRAR